MANIPNLLKLPESERSDDACQPDLDAMIARLTDNPISETEMKQLGEDLVTQYAFGLIDDNRPSCGLASCHEIVPLPLTYDQILTMLKHAVSRLENMGQAKFDDCTSGDYHDLENFHYAMNDA